MKWDRYSGLWPLLGWLQCIPLQEPLVVCFPPQTKTKKSFSLPTSSTRLQRVWHLAMQKPLCIIQKFGPTQMSKWETGICCYETEQGTERPYLFWGFCRCTCCIQVFVVSRIQLTIVGLLNSCKILAGSKVNSENMVYVHALSKWSHSSLRQSLDAQRGCTDT